MIKKLLLIFLFVLTSCGYQPLYSKKEFPTFIVKDLEIIGDKNINERIISALSIKVDENKFQNNKIILENKKTIIETSKDKQGKPDLYKMVVSLKIVIFDKNNFEIEKNFTEEFSYKNKDNKFDLSEYEMNVEQNLVDNIIKKLNIYLNM